jgi:recombination protein RecT
MTNQIQPYVRFRDVMRQDATRQRFEEILGNRAGTFMASLLNLVYGNDKLQECEPGALIIEAMRAAVLDLPLEPSLGMAAVVPYRIKGKQVPRFQPQYKGLIQLALRTNEYSAINADFVYEGEEIVRDRISGAITIKGQRQSDNVIGVFAYFRLKNGFDHYEYMTTEEVWDHATRYSAALRYALEKKLPDYCPWQTHLPDMQKKTLLRRVLKYGPMSIDLKQALAEDDREEEAFEGEVVDTRFETPDLGDAEDQALDETILGEPVIEPDITSEQPQAENGKPVIEWAFFDEIAVTDISSAYWGAAKALGINKQDGNDILKECGGDLDAAYKYLKGSYPA